MRPAVLGLLSILIGWSAGAQSPPAERPLRILGPGLPVAQNGLVQSGSDQKPVPGEWLIRFQPGSKRPQQRSILEPLALETRFFAADRPAVRPQPQALAPQASGLFENLAFVRVNPETHPPEVMQRLSRNPGVVYVEPNYRLHLFQTETPGRTPDDFDFTRLWGLHNTGQSDGQPDADIDAPEAWQIATGDRNVKVAVIDTGIDFFHPDLVENMWVNSGETPGNGLDEDQNGYIDDVHGFDFVSHDSDPMDDLTHGTHVAGTIGARGNNEIGITGVCWEVSLMALKAFDQTGSSSVDRVVEAIQYAIDNGAQIINASWGMENSSRTLEETIQAAQQAGILFVAAAGNDKSDTLKWPAGYESVLSVAATDPEDQRALFSNYGYHIDIAAPGLKIHSTVPNNRFSALSGTSMAAPHVAGVAALIWSAHPEFTRQEVANILKNTTDPVESRQYIGSGRLNAHRALQVKQPLPTVKLDLPETLDGMQSLRGTARGPGFQELTVSYGKGTQPDEWTVVHQSTGAVDDGILVPDFYTPQLEDTEYSFKLTAWNDQGQTVEDRALVRIRNVHIAFPQNNDILRAGQALEIRGTVAGDQRRYTLEYAVGWPIEEWNDSGISLIEGGRKPVQHGVLATWDTGRVAPNRFYTLKLTAYEQDKQIGQSQAHLVYLDDRLKPGWPQYLTFPNEMQSADWRQTQAADLDGDGLQEVIVLDPGDSNGKPSRLMVYNHDGPLKWSRDLGAGPPYSDVPVMGDINLDGKFEIFAEANHQLFGFQHDGSPLPGKWPLELNGLQLGKSVADLDQDGTPELIGFAHPAEPDIGTSSTRRLRVYDPAGNLLRQWTLAGCPHPSIEAPEFLPAVANLDEDPALEIVVVSGCRNISVYDLESDSNPLWTAQVSGHLYASPAVGDINKDGMNEVIIGSYDDRKGTQGGLYAWDHQGGLLPGWPILLDQSFATPPALADFDGDGDMEISVAGWHEDVLHLVHHDGFAAAGWPVKPEKPSKIKTGPIIGDINGDGMFDVIVASPGHLEQTSAGSWTSLGGIKAWNFSGRSIDLKPDADLPVLLMESTGGGPWFKAAPVTLSDLDNNGKMDLIAASIQDIAFSPNVVDDRSKQRSSLYVWELDAAYHAERPPWPAVQQNPQHTGYLLPDSQRQPPAVTDLPNQTVQTGEPFFPLDLDRYVEDPIHPPDHMTWSATGQNQLTVSIDEHRVVHILPPEENWDGSEELTFTATNPMGLQATATAVFTARFDADAPTTGKDHVVTVEETEVEIPVLANDAHPAGKPLSIWDTTQPEAGSVRVTGLGSLVYTPELNYFGTDTFYYTVHDGEERFAMGKVTVDVEPLNDPPWAVEDRRITQEDSPLLIDVLKNDVDPDRETPTLVEFSQPDHGMVELQDEPGMFLYTPELEFNGTDQFTYRIADSEHLESATTVTVMVKPINDPPVIEDQSVSLNRNANRTVYFSGEDPEGEKVTFNVVDGPEHGQLWVYPQVATYYPEKGFAGPDQFTYRASDGVQQSDLATVSLDVLDRNNPPSAQDQSLATKPGQPLEIKLIGSDLDPNRLGFMIVDPPQEGQLEGSGAHYTYYPREGFLGIDRFTYQAWDRRDTSEVAQVEINVTDRNTAPVAKDLAAETSANTAADIKLQGEDDEADPLVYQIITPPQHGQVTGSGPMVRYEPNPDFTGSDRFGYRVNDGELDSQEATVTIAVLAANRPPKTAEQQISVSRNSSITLDLNVSDPDEDTLRSVIFEGPRHGLLAGQFTRYTYTPDPGYVGSDQFTYKSWDGHVYSDQGRVSITVTPYQPSSSGFAFSAIRAQSDGTVHLTLESGAEGRLEVQVSTNLVDWYPLETVTVQSGSVTVTDTNALRSNQRFYRARTRDE